MIRFDHKHSDGVDCFLIRTSHGTYDPIYVSSITDLSTFHSTKVIVAYLDYTSCWYVYDFTTGECLATLRGKHNVMARNLVGRAENQIDPSYKENRVCQ